MVRPERDRLRAAFRLGNQPTAAGGPAAPVPPAGLRHLLQRQKTFQRTSESSRLPVALPPGEVVCTANGSFWRRELSYPFAHRHGDVGLGDVHAIDRERLGALARVEQFARLDLRQCLFLDTETTGLHGGAGTVVFNIGMGRLTDDGVVVEQTFLRDFGEELAMLCHVAERLREFPLLVTFVGKSFDRHRIAARMAVHKVQSSVLTPLHLDLYHLARRAFGRELPDVRLGTVERHRLGVFRDDDLPGSEAPAAFLDWIRDGRGPVDRVLEHNRLDVLSLVALLAVLGRPAA